MKWTEPKLTVFVRGKPEENILVACKADYEAGGPFTGDMECQDQDGGYCWKCQGLAVS